MTPPERYTSRTFGLSMASDIDTYPLTGQFLQGRLRHALDDREKGILEGIVDTVDTFDTSQELLTRGMLCDFSAMLIDGFAIRTISEHGKRYIIGVQVPGDFMDLHSFALKRLDHTLMTLGPATIGRVPHKTLRDVQRNEPHLARLFWFSTLLDGAIHRQWILKLHQLKASRRTAHLLAELWLRLDLVGRAQPDGFCSPLTQADLADMCGTTPIHMNRALGELRKNGIAYFRRGTLTCPDRDRLETVGDFDRSYLYSAGDLHLEDAFDLQR